MIDAAAAQIRCDGLTRGVQGSSRRHRIAFPLAERSPSNERHRRLGGFAEFLQKYTDISGNWDRLHELLELYQDNATVPSSWDIVINITSLDTRRDPVPDFNEAFDKTTTALSSVATEKPPVILDLTHPGAPSKSGKSPPKPSKTSSGKQPHVKCAGKSKLRKMSSPLKIQRRPSRLTPGEDSVRKAGEKTSVPKKSVHTMLPGNVVWKEVRPDLRQALQAGIQYEKSMDWLSSDHEDVESTADDTTADPNFKAPPSDGSPSEDEGGDEESDRGSESDGGNLSSIAASSDGCQPLELEPKKKTKKKIERVMRERNGFSGRPGA
eukprot:jgi/Phyca11/15916/fgenesh1_pg.PHYCAscaffold_16_\